MKKKLRINPVVLFRPSCHQTSGGPRQMVIHVKNLEDNSFYEFKGRSAYLWLLLDGTRSAEKSITDCQNIAGIKDPKFPSMARKFLKDLLEIRLIEELPEKGEKDPRAHDMKKFISTLKGEKPKIKRLPKNKSVRAEPGDQAKIQTVKKIFAKLLKAKIDFSIKRRSPSAFGGHYHIFSARLRLPERKIEEQGFGANLTVERAAMAAVGEAIERFFSFGTSPDVRDKSFNELCRLRKRALDPQSYRFFEPSQRAVKNREVCNVPRDMKMNWTWFEDAVRGGKKILVPAEINAEDSGHGRVVAMGETTSSGCAAATDPATAKVKATLELLERDGLAFYWRTKNTPARIDLSRPNERLRHLLEIIGDQKIKLSYFTLNRSWLP